MFGIPDERDLASHLRGIICNAMNCVELPEQGLGERVVMRGRHTTQGIGHGQSGRHRRTGHVRRQLTWCGLVNRSLDHTEVSWEMKVKTGLQSD